MGGLKPIVVCRIKGIGYVAVSRCSAACIDHFREGFVQHPGAKRNHLYQLLDPKTKKNEGFKP